MRSISGSGLSRSVRIASTSRSFSSSGNSRISETSLSAFVAMPALSHISAVCFPLYSKLETQKLETAEGLPPDVCLLQSAFRVLSPQYSLLSPEFAVCSLLTAYRSLLAIGESVHHFRKP